MLEFRSAYFVTTDRGVAAEYASSNNVVLNIQQPRPYL